jgi:hypothetical protein
VNIPAAAGIPSDFSIGHGASAPSSSMFAAAVGASGGTNRLTLEALSILSQGQNGGTGMFGAAPLGHLLQASGHFGLTGDIGSLGANLQNLLGGGSAAASLPPSLQEALMLQNIQQQQARLALLQQQQLSQTGPTLSGWGSYGNQSMGFPSLAMPQPSLGGGLPASLDDIRALLASAGNSRQQPGTAAGFDRNMPAPTMSDDFLGHKSRPKDF